MSSSFDLNIVVRMFLLKQQIHLGNKQMNTNQDFSEVHTKYQSKPMFRISRFGSRADVISPCYRYIYIGGNLWVHLNYMER